MPQLVTRTTGSLARKAETVTKNIAGMRRNLAKDKEVHAVHAGMVTGLPFVCHTPLTRARVRGALHRLYRQPVAPQDPHEMIRLIEATAAVGGSTERQYLKWEGTREVILNRSQVSDEASGAHLESRIGIFGVASASRHLFAAIL